MIRQMKRQPKSEAVDLSNCHRFAHKAMNTQFEIWARHTDAQYAGQAAHAAFMLADHLETLFSKFIPNSDISRINAAPCGQWIQIDEATYQCLSTAIAMHGQTRGLFDISIGTGLHCLQLQASNPSVLKQEDLTLDLGGIGKGAAVDQMAALLKEWEIDSALIHGGASSVMAFGTTQTQRGWPVTVSNPWQQEILSFMDLFDTAIGSSGIGKGGHIFNPELKKTVEEKRAVWVAGSNAAVCDCFSTAFMMMSINNIRECCRNNQCDALILIQTADKEDVRQYSMGKWPVPSG